jgi:hypothetical protein
MMTRLRREVEGVIGELRSGGGCRTLPAGEERICAFEKSRAVNAWR